jgi:hypothetical protein
MDHRRIQRALFRMQLDPAFASRLRNGDADASRDLAAEELTLLRGASSVAISADRDGKRRAQFLANVSSEFTLSIAAGLAVDAFTASAEFQAAVCADRSLPLAFARYALRCTREQSRPLRALVALESALARARRELRTCRAPSSGEVALAAWVSLEAFPAGTLALAERLRSALDAGAKPPALDLECAPDETLLVLSAPAATAFCLRTAEVERASSALAALLSAACEPVTRAALATALSTDRAELDPVIDELIADRVLVAG